MPAQKLGNRLKKNIIYNIGKNMNSKYNERYVLPLYRDL